MPDRDGMFYDEKTKARIKRSEGLRLTPYRDSVGVLTIGYGTNIERITVSEAEVLFEFRYRDSVNAAMKYRWFHTLDRTRKSVIVDMIYNLGARGFATFEKMIAALEKSDFETAADEMLDSKWSGQVGKRADELATLMRPKAHEGRRSIG